MAERVCVVTGTRAEYGLFRPLLDALEADPAFDVLLVATGAHLSPAFGMTVDEILADGRRVDERVEMLLASDTEVGAAKSTGLGVIGFADAFARLAPDCVVLLGDRFETLSAAVAAHLARIPIAHLHGGELTEGAIDDAMRHAITKMSMLHFTSAEPYRRRVVQLGEEPDRVFAVGALGVDNALNVERLSREELESEIGFELGPCSAVVTFHPVTLSTSGETEFAALLSALERTCDLRLVFTRPNADPGNRGINRMLDSFLDANPDRSVAYASLGSVRYLSLLAQVDVVVGNSSSGVIEAPSFGVPTVDVGDRQRGRIAAASVFRCEADEDAILAAVERALTPAVRAAAKGVANPYGDGRAAQRITAVLRERLPSLRDTRKRFHDVAFDLPAEG
ncbi:MAG: UDP-N-acetylglucosamine 2-epimerase [Coriobacteriia bacterium]